MWNLPELRSLDRILDRFTDESKFKEMGFPSNKAMTFTPACEVFETDTHYLFGFDLPGMTKDEIKVEVTDNMLKVYGERKEEREEKKKNTFRSERFYGSFERFLGLPNNVNADEVEATYENGVLNVAVSKLAAAKTHKVKIAEGRQGVFAKLLSKKETGPPGTGTAEVKREKAAS